MSFGSGPGGRKHGSLPGPNPGGKKPSKLGPKVCENCGREGHVAKKCRFKVSNSRSGANDQTTGSSSQAGGNRGRDDGGGRGYVADEESGQRSQSVPGFRGQELTGELRYPRSRSLTTNDRTITGSGRTWNFSSDFKKQKDKQKDNIKTPKYPLRDRFLDNEPNTRLLTNHFEYAIDAKELFEYKILDIPSKNRRKVKKIYQQAIDQWSFLAAHTNKFVTNRYDTIVSWINLHEHIKRAPEKENGTDLDSWKIPLSDGDDSQDLRFQLVRRVTVNAITNYAIGHPNFENENFDAVAKCLNLIISQSLDDEHLHRQSSNKFFVKDARVEMQFSNADPTAPVIVSKSLEMVRGYYYTVKPGMGNIILNFNLATSAFFKPILVSEFLADTLTFAAKTRGDQLKGLEVILGSSRVDTTDHNSKRENSTKTVKSLSKVDIEDLKFHTREKGADGKFLKNANGSYVLSTDEKFVTEHLNKTFKNFKAIIGRKAINCGTDQDPIWYAQEQLRIAPWQILRKPVPTTLTASMVNEAAKGPDLSRALIENEGLRKLGFTHENTQNADLRKLNDNGPISLVPTMMQVPYQELPCPIACYMDTKLRKIVPLKANVSRWKISKDHAFTKTGGQHFKFGFMRVKGDVEHEQATKDAALDVYRNKFSEQLVKCGLSSGLLDEVTAGGLPDLRLEDSEKDTLRSALQAAKDAGLSLVVLALKKHDVQFYSNFKEMADRDVGIHTVCLTQKRFKKDDYFDEFISNIMMKINLKRGGINHIVSSVEDNLRIKDTMILGADVIHPGPGSYAGCPSIAAIVGSVDYTAGRCLGSMRLQAIENNGVEVKDREIIQDVESMVIERLRDWLKYSNTAVKKLPRNILYYRDGVSSGQYDKVKSTELRAIRSAYREVSTNKSASVNITAVIVTKRHHTRFFPISKRDGREKDKNLSKEQQKYPDRDSFGNYNTKPGTFVDRLVTSPYYQDFFLQSHSGIKGTAKPTHYFVLEAGIKSFTSEQLRDMTHHLCYTYVRATVGVSYASPTYYADRLCERGRTYVRKYFVQGTDPVFDKKLDDELKNKKNELDNLSKARIETKYPKPPAGQQRNNEEKRAIKREQQDDRKSTQMALRRLVFGKVKDEFEKYRADKSKKTEDGPWLNPWNKDIANTMFWM